MKLPFWATVFTALGVSVLLSLSAWQVVRLEWKSNLIAALDAEYRIDASHVPLAQKDFSDETLFRRGFIAGRFLDAPFIFLTPRVHDDKVGGHVLMPFLPEGHDSPVLVNRGWAVTQEEAAKCVTGQPDVLRLAGMMRKPLRENMFVPANDPSKGAWYRMDMHQIAEYTNTDILDDRVFYVESQTPDLPCLVMTAGKIEIPNNHLQYALFWLGMALVLLTIFLMRFALGKSKHPSHVDESA